jgi:glutamine amidotransferase-like uncharacterized protein
VRLLKQTIRFIGFGIMLIVGFMVGYNEKSYAATLPSVEGSYALIYNGPVADKDGTEAVAAIVEQVGLPVKYVSDIAELPRLLNDAAVFIIGGTEDDLEPLLDAFTPEVTAALKTYLRNGGRYLGICGGGYMASTGWEEDEGFVETLGVIPAKSESYVEDYDSRILSIRWLGETRLMYFQAGPVFDLVQSPEAVEVIAYYDDDRIAALVSSYGEGKVAVSGPHPESPESWKDDAANGGTMTLSTDLAVALLQDLLSNRPVNR